MVSDLAAVVVGTRRDSWGVSLRRIVPFTELILY
jgi:hypothetical protein